MGAIAKRRRADRYILTAEDYRSVSLVRLNGDKELLDAQLVNLSATGALVEFASRVDVDVEDPFLFEFKVPTTDDVIVWKARVARVDWKPQQFRLGMEFVDLPVELHSTLEYGLEPKLAEQKIDSYFNICLKIFSSRGFRDFLVAALLGGLITAGLIYFAQTRGEATNKFEFFKTFTPQ